MDKGKDDMNLTLSAMGRDQLFHLRGNTFSREHWLLWKPIQRCQSNILFVENCDWPSFASSRNRLAWNLSRNRSSAICDSNEHLQYGDTSLCSRTERR